MAKNEDFRPEDFEPGTFGHHEALHTCDMLVRMISQYLENHPAIQMNPAWKARVEEAGEILADLYQELGAAIPDRCSAD